MSKLNQYVEDNNLNKNNENKSNETVNLAIKVTNYLDGDLIEGVRIDTGEIVRGRMRNVEQKGELARPSIADFKTKNHKRFAPKDKSILMLENCYLESDGVWNTRWINTFSTPKRPSTVVVLNSHLRIVENGENSYVEVNAIKSKALITSGESLKESLLRAFTAKVHRARNYAIIRLTDADGAKFIIKAFPDLIEVVDPDDADSKTKVMNSPENSYNKFVEDSQRSKIVFDLMNDPEITIEVFMASRLYLGGDTNTRIISTPYMKNGIKKEYNIESVEGDKKIIEGYKKTIIAFRSRDDGSMFVTGVKQVVNNTIATSIENLEI